MNPWILLGLAIVAEVIGTSALKLSEGMTKPLPSAVAVVGIAAAFYLLSLTLSSIPVGIVYAVWAGVGIALISVIGHFAFGQVLDLPALAGIGLILAGVVVIHTLSGSVPH